MSNSSIATNQTTSRDNAGGTVTRPLASRPQTSEHLISFLLRYGTVLLLGVLLIITTVLVPSFWQTDNLSNLVSQNTPIGLIAIAMTFVVISGNFDLSVGSVFAAGAVFYATMATEMSLGSAAVATLVVGAIAGLINGIVVTKFEVNSLIATLGTGAAFSGLTFLYCDSTAVTVSLPGFDLLGLGVVGGLPATGLILGVAFLVGGLVLGRSVYGRRVYAVGGSGEAARLAGIRVGLLITSTFVLVGAASAFGGAILASQLGVGQPTIGATVALDAFAIVVIGGTSVYGGEGALWRTAVGLAIVSVMSNLFNSLTLDPALQSIAKGAILVLALGLDTLSRRRTG
jgi:ribose transport system permease protein